jgi:hypothetical protein
MIDKDKTVIIKSMFSEVVKVLVDSDIIPKDFVGKFQVNCNSGGVTSVDANITIR